MRQEPFPVIQIRFPVLQGPLPVVSLGQSFNPSPGLAAGYTTPMCLCDKLREQDAERAWKKKRGR